MNAHARNSTIRSTLAKRVTLLQNLMECVLEKISPQPRRRKTRRTDLSEAYLHEGISMLDELGKIAAGMLVLHGHTLPKRR
jgi:hypothetical protein